MTTLVTSSACRTNRVRAQGLGPAIFSSMNSSAIEELLSAQALLFEEFHGARMVRGRHVLAYRLGIPAAERAEALDQLRLVLVHRLGDSVHDVVLDVRADRDEVVVRHEPGRAVEA